MKWDLLRVLSSVNHCPFNRGYNIYLLITEESIEMWTHLTLIVITNYLIFNT